MRITLNEESIERTVERRIDRLDALFMAGKIHQLEYDIRMKAIREWADKEWDAIAIAR